MTTMTTKATTARKVTKTACVFVVFVAFVSFVTFVVGAQRQEAPTQAQQRPVFRGGTHFVRVDAYPSKDGKILEGLKPDDFEVLEDGKPQAIESFDFIKFDTFTPEAERRDPISQQAGFDLAADPRYRVFVVFVAMSLSNSPGAVVSNEDLGLIEQPLVNFFERVVGPSDLYGFLTSRNSVKDLVLGQKTIVTVEQVKNLWRANNIDRDEADITLDTCDCGPKIVGPACDAMIQRLKTRYRADATYTALTQLVNHLGQLRQERKNLVLVTNLLPRWREDLSFLEARGANIPQTGIAHGRITTDERTATILTNQGTPLACPAEFQRLAMLDFEPRYWELLEDARRENVTVYAITPGGLQAPPSLAAVRAMRKAYDDLEALSINTDGIAVTGTNDLNAGMRQIGDNLAAYYLLGYYSTNTKFDGHSRKITVRLKSDGKAIRARREYRAPTEAEIAKMTSRPAAPAHTPVETGPPAVIGEPIAYRVSRAQPIEKVRLLEFVRADRLRVEWPVLAPLDRREARLLDSAGKPLPIDLPLSEAPDRTTIVVELPLAPFGRGIYSIELTAGAGGRTEQRKLTFMMK